MTRTLPRPVRRRALLAGAVVAVVGLLSGAAHATTVDPAEPRDPASSTVTWGVRPADVEPHEAGRPNFAYDVEAGETVSDALVVTNYTEQEATFGVYAADAFTTADGALDLVRQDEASIGVGAWTTTRESEVTVPAGESVVVPFTLEVPRDAEPGDHAGGIVTSLTSAHQEQGINVERRLGSRIHVRVDGELAPAAAIEQLMLDFEGTVNPVAAGTAGVSFWVANTGNTRLAGDATVRLVGPFGLGASSQDVTLPELLPGERTELSLRLTGALPLVRLGAEVELTPHVVMSGAGLDTVTATAGTTAIPWSLLALLLAAVALALVTRRRRRVREAATARRIAEAVAASRAQSSSTDDRGRVVVPHAGA